MCSTMGSPINSFLLCCAPRTITAQFQHNSSTITAQLQHNSSTITAQFQHNSSTITAQLQQVLGSSLTFFSSPPPPAG
jgi:hypothetical protein